jgi:acyl-CoA synthetase (NDP forming)
MASFERAGRDLAAIARMVSGETTKPIVVAWTLPRSAIAQADEILRAARIPVYDSFALATAAVAALCPARA